MMNPATTAVHKPRSGVTPLAIAKAMASGSATIPTMIPAVRSLVNSARGYDFSALKTFGTIKENDPCGSAFGHRGQWEHVPDVKPFDGAVDQLTERIEKVTSI